MRIIFWTLVIIFPVFNVLLGLLLFLNPTLTIELQKEFYAKINWRVEPISMQKEIRNTRFMGMLLLVVTVLLTTYIILAGI